jgi:hypothetical protein
MPAAIQVCVEPGIRQFAAYHAKGPLIAIVMRGIRATVKTDCGVVA